MSSALVVSKRITKIDTIEIDSCLEETHDLTNTVTDHPVEDGFNISDHNRPDPDIVTLRCFISNTPLSVDQQQRSIRAGDTTFKTTAAQSVKIGAVNGRADNNYKALKKLRDEGTLITVVTSLRTYTKTSKQGLTILGLSIPRTRYNYDGLEFTLKVKLIRIVTNRATQSSKAKQKKKSTRPADNKGAAATENEDSAAFQIEHSDTGEAAKQFIQQKFLGPLGIGG